ncbi:MAG: hypothetical protein ACJAX7_000963 [Saprospiraceae bacterium]|jgi:hypothetical protein
MLIECYGLTINFLLLNIPKIVSCIINGFTNDAMGTITVFTEAGRH